MKAIIFQGEDKQWHWHFIARNGRIVADAEAFPSRANALRAAKACVKSITRNKNIVFDDIVLNTALSYTLMW